jgi:class 3 adenylate cyclase
LGADRAHALTMRCGACGVALIAGKPFCHACGEAVARRCGACGAALEESFRFCPECGSNVDAAGAEAPPAPPVRPRAGSSGDGERKQVTVLFCDLVGSTAIADRLDPEDFHDLLEKYLAVAFPAVYRFDGIVNQLAGDGLLALFGAPVAHEDDPQRAVRAALAVRDAVHGLAERLEAAGGPSLTVRIGVHTGPVVVGSFGTELKADYTAIGDTTNLASRLQGVAAPGAILISEATQRLVRGFFELRFAGEHAIKGKVEPVRTYEVLGRTSQATSMSIAAARGLTPYVGREAELQQLEACFAQLGRGRSQVVTVVGGAGSGKSRLLFELRRRLQGEPVTFFEAYSSSLGGVLYHPVVGMLRRYFGLEATDSAEEKTEKLAARLGFGFDHLEQMYPRFSRFLSVAGDERLEAAGDELKRETFDAVGRLLVGRSQHEPVIVFLEDMQWYDRASRELLGDLIGRLERSRIMVISTCRPDETVGWRTRAVQTEIALSPLEDDEVRAIARGVVGAVLPRSVEELVVSRAAGSPFFAEELTRTLVEEGWLVRDEDGGSRLTRPARDLPVPGTVQEVIAARLDRLPADAKRVLQVAAVLGRSFRLPDVVALLQEESIDVAAALADLEARGLLHSKLAQDGDELRFGESLTREVAYEGLLLRQRRDFHARVARLLESQADHGGPHRSALLAHHLALSDDRERAVHAMNQAARDAEGVPSYETAAELFRQAAALAEDVLAEHDTPALRAEALAAHFSFVRLTVLFGLPFILEAHASSERARELAEAVGGAEMLSSIVYFQGALTLSIPGGDFAAGLALAEDGVRLATEAGLAGHADRLKRGLAVNYALDGRFDEARDLGESAVRRCAAEESLEAPSDAHLSARWVKAFVMYASDDLDGALRFASETDVAARRMNNRTIQCILGTMIAQIHLLRAEYVLARDRAETALGMAETIGNVNAYPGAAAVVLAAKHELGEPVEARRYLDLIDRGLDPGGLVQMNFRFVSDGWLASGAGDAGIARLQAMQRTGGGRFRRALLALSHGDLVAAEGDVAGARAAYDEALALARSMRARSLFVQAAVGRAGLGRAEMGRAAGSLQDVLSQARLWCDELRLERYRPRLLHAIAGLLGEATPMAAASS